MLVIVNYPQVGFCEAAGSRELELINWVDDAFPGSWFDESAGNGFCDCLLL